MCFYQPMFQQCNRYHQRHGWCIGAQGCGLGRRPSAREGNLWVPIWYPRAVCDTQYRCLSGTFDIVETVHSKPQSNGLRPDERGRWNVSAHADRDVSLGLVTGVTPVTADHRTALCLDGAPVPLRESCLCGQVPLWKPRIIWIISTESWHDVTFVIRERCNIAA